MLPITEGGLRPRNALDVRAKDDHLRRVLEGRDHLLFDGAMGTMLQRAGLEAGELPELLCITHPRADRGRAIAPTSRRAAKS
jgi:5-methyltetrahydrofolate--homocysteine methyltransferase